jgi:hypothetical protein
MKQSDRFYSHFHIAAYWKKEVGCQREQYWQLLKSNKVKAGNIQGETNYSKKKAGIKFIVERRIVLKNSSFM